MKVFKYLTIYIFSLLVNTLYAQTQEVNVFTKKVTKDLPSGLKHLKLLAEKANINVSGWDNPYVSLELKLVSKHPDKKVALKDLGFAKYAIDNHADEYIVRNYFQGNSMTDKLKSNVTAYYDVKVPKNLSLEIANIYGNVTLSWLKGITQVSINFGQLTLQNISGQLKVDSNYGDIIGHNILGEFNCKSGKANILLYNAGGTLNIKGRYGKFFLDTPELQALTIEGVHMSVELKADDLKVYNWVLQTNYGNIISPDVLGELKSSPTKKELVSAMGSKPIKIKTQFSDIIVTTKTHKNSR